MSRLGWDRTSERFFETGTSHGVLYIPNAFGAYDAGFAWNGITAITESPSGAESNKQYADNQVYLNIISAEEFSGSIEAFTSPKEFDQCDGSASPIPGISVGQQTRKSFGLSYRTLIGNDIDGQDHGYKIHVVYGATASPSERPYATVNESPEAMALSWEFETVPTNVEPEIVVEGRALKPTSKLSFSSLEFSSAKMKQLEDVLYGTTGTVARLPNPYELITMMSMDIVSVTAPAPTLLVDELTIPTSSGVRYTVNGAPVTSGQVLELEIDAAVIVVALANVGYALDANEQSQWFFKVTE